MIPWRIAILLSALSSSCLVVSAQPLSITEGPDLGKYPMGTMEFGLHATGGTPPYSFSVSPIAAPIPDFRIQNRPTLPSFFPPDVVAVLFGVATAPGNYATTLRVTDQTGTFFDKAIFFNVSAVEPATGFLPETSIGDTYNYQLTATGGTGPYTWSVPSYSGPLPPGILLSSSGMVSGIATVAGQYNFSVTLTDAVGNTIDFGYGIFVNQLQLITSRSLPNGIAGLDYGPVTLQVAGGSPPYTFSVAPGWSFPSGLNLSSTGVITGRPSYAYTWWISIVVTDTAGNSLQRIIGIVTINNSFPTPLQLTAPSDLGQQPLGAYGLFYRSIDTFGGVPPYTYSIEPGSSLPPGIFLLQGLAVDVNSVPMWDYLQGRVVALGDYSFTLRVTDSLGNSDARAFRLKVVPLNMENLGMPLPGSTATFNAPFSQQILALGGTPPYSWLAPGLLPDALTLSSSGVLSGTTKDTGWSSFDVRVTDATGAFLQRTASLFVDSGTPSTLRVDNGPDLGTFSTAVPLYVWLSASGSPLASPNYRFSVTPDSTLPPGAVLLSGASLPAFVNTTGFLGGILSTPGLYRFGIAVNDDSGNFGRRTLQLRASPLYVQTTSLPIGSVGVPYSFQLAAIGGTGQYSWSLLPDNSLPAGLVLSSGGLISGTPTTAGVYNLGISVTDGAGNSITQYYGVQISPLNITSPAVLPAGAVGLAYSFQFTATGPGPYLWSSNYVPSGMTLDQNTGVLSGTPQYGTEIVLQITVGNGTTTFSKVFSLPVRDPSSPAVQISSFFQDATLGQYYVSQLYGYGGLPPYTWSLVSGSLPPGLTLMSGQQSGWYVYQPDVTVLAGVPTATGTFTFTLQATDASGGTNQQAFSLRVSKIAVANAGLTDGTLGQPYSHQLVAVGGTPPYSFGLASGTLPPGMNLSASGLIRGTPTNTGSFSFNVTTTDSAGGAFLQGYYIFVDAVNPNTPTLQIYPYDSDLSLSNGGDYSMGMFQSVFFYEFSSLSGAFPITWSFDPGSSLPPGMTLQTFAGDQSSSASLSGVPTVAGSYTFTIRATDGFGNFGVKTYTLLVTPLNLQPTNFAFNITAPPPGRVGSLYTFQIPLLNAALPVTFALLPNSSLPPGVTLNPAGTLSGTPASPGFFYFTFIATDAAGTTLRKSLYLSVYPAGSAFPLSVVGSNGSFPMQLPDASAGTTYIYQLNDLAFSGNPPYAWALAAGSTLPAGLSLVPGSGNVSAKLSGMPGAAGDYSFNLTVTDGRGQSSPAALALHVSPITIGLALFPSLQVGSAFSVSLQAAGGTGPYTFSLANGSAMPPGMALSSTGIFSGTPALSGFFTVIIAVTDANSVVLNKTYIVSVFPVGAHLLSASSNGVSLTYVQGAPAPGPIPISVTAIPSSVSYTVFVSGGAWLSAGPTPSATPGTVNINVSPAALSGGEYDGVVTISSAQAANSPLTIPVTLTVAPAAPCTYGVSPGSGTLAASGGAGSFSVAAGPQCSWSASTTAPWITLSSPGSGTGVGAVNFNADVNTNPSTRSATIDAAGQSYLLTQFGAGCAFSMSPPGASLTYTASTGNFNLTASNNGCSWNASASDPWITITSPLNGSGSAVVAIQIATNPNPTNRTSTVSAGGQTFTVSQAGFGCSYNLSAPGAAVLSTGGTPSVEMLTGQNCSWTASSGPAWITVISPFGGNGTGMMPVAFSVAPNSSTQARSGNVLIGGQIFQVTQAGVACSFSLSSDNPLQPAVGGSGTVNVYSAGSGCGWVASSNVPWLTIASGSSGNGAGVVSFSVLANNTTTARSGTLTIAGQNMVVTQAGTLCSFSLRSGNAIVSGLGGSSSVGVVTAAGCPWVATSDSSWITITSGAASMGSGDVQFTVAPNVVNSQRSGILNIAGQNFGVTEQGAPCTFTLSSSSTIIGSGGGAGSFTYTSSVAGCAAPVSSYSSWVTINSASLSGTTGTVNFTVAANITANPRSGNILVGSTPYQVSEAPALCNVGLNSSSATFDRFGGFGSVAFVESPQSCTPIIGVPIPGLTLGALSGGSGSFTQGYSVDVYQTFIRWVRTLEIDISGQLYVVKQTSW